MLQMQESHLKMLKGILEEYRFKFYVFGSRAKNKANTYSDLDLFYKESIPITDLIAIEEGFVA